MNSPYGLPADGLDCHLRSDDFLCALSPESLAALNQMKRAAALREGTVIFVEGQIPRGIFMLCEGQVKLSTTSREGKTFVLRIARAGEVLGLGPVVTGKPHVLTAKTMQTCQLNFVNREDFLRFLKGYGDACLLAAEHISRNCQHAYDVARSIGLSHSVSGRVAKFLLASATDGQVTNGVVRARLAMTHEEIAQITGTSRESITRILSEFRRKDVVELKGSTLIIHNKPALERLVAA
jgi:CRP/FNR family transcriptional regulator, cyclic AMP receptor protein